MINNIINSLKQIEGEVSPGGVLVGDDVRSRPDSWPPVGPCKAMAIIRPATVNELSAVLRICHQANLPVVTHGGLTGLVWGARTTDNDIVISLERMNRIQTIDTVNRTVTVEAGVILQNLHEAVEQQGLLFPLDLGARGSCTIGGTIATNAGGNSVIRYGMMREQVLGLEAVMADGTIISSLKGVIKNNTGYDLKQLFIGSEGTLGIVTRAVLRLRPLPVSCNTAFVGIEDFDKLGRFLNAMDSAMGGTLSAFEVMWNDFYSLITGANPSHKRPLPLDYPYYVLLESTGGDQASDRKQFEDALQAAFESELLADAVVAESRQQRHDLWAIRDDIDTLIAEVSPPILFDISLEIPLMERFVEQVRSALTQKWPNAKMVAFGHLGDGNIHLNISVGSDEPREVHAVDTLVYAELAKCNGVVSAEHGIGLMKREFLKHSRSDAEMDLMRALKHTMDPKGILNPGKIFDV